MAKKPQLKSSPKKIESLTHSEATRKNIPTAEYQSVIQKEEEKPKALKYPRNTDLDPQLVWRGKDYQDWSDLVVQAPPLYIQEKVHPKALIDDLLRQSRETRHEAGGVTPDLFADFNGIPKGVDKTEFYQHDQNWSNRMILGDSLQVMASLTEREGLRGKVQCIYFDPPYGINFNSNFQWSTTSRDVKDGKADHITREPEQVKAFRDTWRDGIHSYLTYLRDRLTVARDLLTDSGSIFVQIGDENVHRVRALMDEVLGDSNLNRTRRDWHSDAHADRSRVVTSLEQSARSCCAETYDSGDSPGGASPHAGRITPRPVWVPVSAPSAASVRRWPDAERSS
ncbi:MAG: DNA methyltransferase, partial [Gammaproteobacteria bacterium]